MGIQCLISEYRARRKPLLEKYRAEYALLDNESERQALHDKYQVLHDELERWFLKEVATYYGTPKTSDQIRLEILEKVEACSPVKGVLVKHRKKESDLLEHWSEASEDWKDVLKTLSDNWVANPILFPTKEIPEHRRLLILFGLIKENCLQILGDGENAWLEITEDGKGYMRYLSVIGGV